MLIVKGQEVMTQTLKMLTSFACNTGPTLVQPTQDQWNSMLDTVPVCWGLVSGFPAVLPGFLCSALSKQHYADYTTEYNAVGH